MRQIHRVLYPLIIIALLSACNLVISRAPGLYILESGLGEYENKPTWFWEVYGPDVIEGFRYSFDSENSWIAVDENTRRFQPVEPLDPGEYTLYLQARSASGYWSRTVSETATVATSDPFRPNDTYFKVDAETGYPGQWALEIMGMPALWGHLKYLEKTGVIRNEVVVAVIDTGYTEHPDLVENLLTQEGYDFISDTAYSGDHDGIDSDATDDGGSWHGTEVAGAIAAVTDNGEGIAGIGLSKLKVLPVRALGASTGNSYDIAYAIRYAAGLDNPSGTTRPKPAKIINLSLGGGVPDDDGFFEMALAEATAQRVIVLAAAGNSRETGDREVDYPASSEYTIAVAATTYAGGIAPYSNPGEKVDIAAPGGRGGDEWDPWEYFVITASLGSSLTDYAYAGVAGTSIACPHVSGILGLLCTVDDTMDLATARELLARSATDLGEPGWDPDFGNGLVNGLGAYGAYKLLLDSGWKGYEADRKSAVIQPPPADAEPTGELAEASLIVRYRTAGTAKSLGAADRLRALGATQTDKGFSKDRVIRPDPGVNPVSLRKKLLEEPDIEAVFYNYTYRPL